SASLRPPPPSASGRWRSGARSTWAAGGAWTATTPPGHAKHHVGLIASVGGDLYVGDAAGGFIEGTQDLRPATPPPDFDLDLALGSLRMFAALAPARLLFSHFGPVDEVAQTLERSAEELNVWVEQTRRAHKAGLDLDHAVAMVTEQTRQRY